MSLMHVKDYLDAERQIQRVLVSGDELLMSITHPLFFAPTSRWIRDGAGRSLFFAVDL